MATAPSIRTIADLLRDLGVDADRILFRPPPGTATEQDLLDGDAHQDRLVELFDGVLVEKAMGFEEAVVGAAIVFALKQHVTPRDLGVVAGSDGMVRYREGVVQLADAAYFSWDRFPDRRLPGDTVSRVVPDIAIEVLSRSNTTAEMQRKRHEYFDAGVSLVWFIDHRARTVTVFTTPEHSRTLARTISLMVAPSCPSSACQ